MFHFATLVVVLVFVSGLRVLAQTATTLSYDNNYDNANLPLSQVACSDGTNGLGTTYTTLGSIPTFPNVGGAPTVSGYGSPECGACYAVTYESTTVNILAVDKSTNGFTVSEEAMNTLTGNRATYLGRVDVSYVQVSSSDCGLPSTS